MGASGKRGELGAAPSHMLLADALRQRIALGGFEPGDRLPTERELAGSLGVGRNTVRRALRLLAEEGLVETEPGRNGGTRVRPPAAPEADAPDGRNRGAVAASLRATLRDYMEYREAIEATTARLAAERGSTAERRALLRLLDEPVADLSDYHRLDSRFHLGLGAAAGNEVLQEAVARARTEMFVGGNALWLQADWHLVYPPGHDLGQVFREEHLGIALAVLAGDADAAEAGMGAHLREAHTQFLVLLDRFASGG